MLNPGNTRWWPNLHMEKWIQELPNLYAVAPFVMFWWWHTFLHLDSQNVGHVTGASLLEDLIHVSCDAWYITIHFLHCKFSFLILFCSFFFCDIIRQIIEHHWKLDRHSCLFWAPVIIHLQDKRTLHHDPLGNCNHPDRLHHSETRICYSGSYLKHRGTIQMTGCVFFSVCVWGGGCSPLSLFGPFLHLSLFSCFCLILYLLIVHG